MRPLPLIVGSSNPHSADPTMALYPHPRGSSGWRLFRMSGMKVDAYLRSFARTNLSDGRPNLGPGDAAVLLGLDVASSLGAEAKFWLRQELAGNGASVWVVPHPSGRCRLYNDHRNVVRLRAVLRRAIWHHGRMCAARRRTEP